MGDHEKLQTYTHVVVQFPQEQVGGKCVVDLIPIKWLDNGGKSCCYPHKKQYKHLEKWVIDCKDPEPSWLQSQESQEVILIKKCVTYEKGIKRLKKYMDSLDAESTSATEGFSVDDTGTSLQCISNVLASKSRSEENSMGPNEKSNKEKRRAYEHEIDNTKEALQLLYTTITKKMRKAFDSIDYDVQLKLQETEYKFFLNLGRPLGRGLREDQQKLNQILPMTNIDVFEAFDSSLEVDLEKSMALKNLMRKFANTKSTVENAVRAILPELIEKEVQMKYSGGGKKNSNLIPAKKNFSATNTFKCMCEVINDILSKMNQPVNVKVICQMTGKWLKGASDRGGGRKARMSFEK